jgi:hypothetical protein
LIPRQIAELPNESGWLKIKPVRQPSNNGPKTEVQTIVQKRSNSERHTMADTQRMSDQKKGKVEDEL